MIPKIIHYCWFGKREKNSVTKKCIQSWIKFLPDYKLIEWNEENCDIYENMYVIQAYNCKKYAFVSDYFRLKALYEHGGIYFDTDYELIRSIEAILSDGSFITGMENINSALTAIIAVEPKHPLIESILKTYENRHFLLPNGKMDLTPINEEFSSLLEQYGVDLSKDIFQRLDNGIRFYPIEILCGFDVNNWHEKIGYKTVGVHHMGNSWALPKMKFHIVWIRWTQAFLGYDLYDKIRKIIKGK